jgi:hypothetical protein
MAINFPTSPSTNDTHTTTGGITYKWDGTSWKAQGSTTQYILPTASSTVLGGIKVGNRLTISSGVLSADVQGGLTSDAQGNTVGGTDAGDAFTGTDAEDNTILGYEAGTDITSGDDNTLIGYRAGYDIDTGVGNTIVGKGSGYEMTNGQNNCLMGANTAIRIGNGQGNVAIGSNALATCVGGSHNIVLGYMAANDITSGSHNIALGNLAGDTLQTGSNNIFIGANTVPTATNTSNEVVIGDSNISKFKIPGINFTLKDSTATEDYVLTVDANGEAGWEAAAGGSASSRTTANASTPSLASGEHALLDINNVAKSYGLMKIQTSHAAWVTLYISQAARTADVNRAATTDPVPGAGVVAEVITNGDTTQVISPMLMGFNDESSPVDTVYAKVRNETGSATVIQVTLTFVPLEA